MILMSMVLVSILSYLKTPPSVGEILVSANTKLVDQNTVFMVKHL